MNFLMKILQFRQFPHQSKRRQSVKLYEIIHKWKFPLKISFQSMKANFEMICEMKKSGFIKKLIHNIAFKF